MRATTRRRSPGGAERCPSIDCRRSPRPLRVSGPAEARVLLLPTPSAPTSRCGTPQVPALAASASASSATTRGATAAPPSPGAVLPGPARRGRPPDARRPRRPPRPLLRPLAGRADRDVARLARGGADRAPRVVQHGRPHRSSDTWNARIETVRSQGMGAIATGVMERWFSADFRERAPEVVARARALLEGTPPLGYAGLRAADPRRGRAGAPRRDTRSHARDLRREDPATPPADGRFLADAIPGARYVELEAAHLSSLEARRSLHVGAPPLPRPEKPA